jgi:hypothetical protein
MLWLTPFKIATTMDIDKGNIFILNLILIFNNNFLCQKTDGNIILVFN